MKYQKYEKYKISNNPWFSELPENWDVSRIKFNSILFGRIGYRGYSTDDLVDEKEGAITLSPSNMINGKLDFSKCTYLSWDKYNESPEIKMRDHDVVMVKTGSTIGKVSFAEKIEYPTTINPQLVLYKKIKCNPKFLFYYLFSKNAQDRIPLYNSGSTIPTMKQEDIGRFYLPMPSMNEQNSIVEFLDRETTHIDRLIEKKQKLIELLKEKRTALITKAVTKGLNPDVKMKDSGIEWLGEVPEHWDNWKLAHGYGLIGSGTTPKSDSYNYYDDGEVPWVTTSELRESVILDTKNKLTKSAIATYSSLKKYPKGTLIMAMYGATIGRLGILGIPATVNQACCAFSHPIVFDNYFVYYWLWMARPVLISLSYGGGQPNLNQDMLKKIVIPIPELEEQREIVNYLGFETKKIDDLVEKIEQAIIKHQEYRTAIISAAVTGKIKVTQD